MLRPTNTPDSVLEAMQYVLTAAEQADETIAQSHKQAEEILFQARKTVRSIHKRTTRRIIQLHRSRIKHSKKEVHTMLAANFDRQDGDAVAVLDDQNEKKLQQAMEQLAMDLTSRP